MQFIISEEEMAALKAKRGIDPEKFKVAGVTLREDLIHIAENFIKYPPVDRVAEGQFQHGAVIAMRKALDKFEKALDSI